MSRQRLCLWVFAVSLVLGSGFLPAREQGQATPTISKELPQLVKGQNAFGWDLYQKLKDEPGNLFISPYSIYAALLLTYAGARGNTAAEMEKVLHANLKGEAWHRVMKEFNSLVVPPGGPQGYELSIANALWGQEGYPFSKAFLALLDQQYQAGMHLVDYIKAAEKARRMINDWVKTETRGKILDLIPPGILDKLTELVLTNAIYFKGKWKTQFDVKDTKEEEFWLTGDKKIKVPLMRLTLEKDFEYADAGKYQSLTLPYQGDELSLVILLPKEKDGLTELEKSLAAGALEEALPRTPCAEVHLYLPRFKFSTPSLRLEEPLVALGMKEAFQKAADFSGMREDARKDLFIYAVVHKTFVEVNEEGTEAAAATAVVMARLCIMGTTSPVEFRADHPFLFLIKHKKTGAILFLGRVVNPQCAGD